MVTGNITAAAGTSCCNSIAVKCWIIVAVPKTLFLAYSRAVLDCAFNVVTIGGRILFHKRTIEDGIVGTIGKTIYVAGCRAILYCVCHLSAIS